MAAITLPRRSEGYASPAIDDTGGPAVALKTPSSKRKANSIAKLDANAEPAMARLQTSIPYANSDTLRTRSVNIPIGTVARAPTMVDADARSPRSVFVIPNSSFRLGASAPTAPWSVASSARAAVEEPPVRLRP